MRTNFDSQELGRLAERLGARSDTEAYLRLRQQESLEGIRASLSQMAQHARDIPKVEEWISEYPWASMAVGATGGFIASKVVLPGAGGRDNRGRVSADENRRVEKPRDRSPDPFWAMIAEPVQTLVAALLASGLKQLFESPEEKPDLDDLQNQPDQSSSQSSSQASPQAASELAARERDQILRDGLHREGERDRPQPVV